MLVQGKILAPDEGKAEGYREDRPSGLCGFMRGNIYKYIYTVLTYFSSVIVVQHLYMEDVTAGLCGICPSSTVTEWLGKVMSTAFYPKLKFF